MEVAAEAMSPLLRKLGELLLEEYNLEKHVRKGVKSLLTELELMHVVLCKVGEAPPDPQVRIWAGKVRELSYDMEDAVDSFMVRVEDLQPTNMKNRVKNFFQKTINLFSKGKALHQISDAIQEAQDLAKELSDLRKRYELDMDSTGVRAATIDPRLIDMYKDVKELVGIEESRDELIQMMTEGDERSNEKQLKTISIVGFGGLGKTTLAKSVYDVIKMQFDCWAFVSVSRSPDMNKIFKDIMYELDKNKFRDIHVSARDEKLLIDELREFLEDKRYLIIIDDIWDEKTWRIIKCALSSNVLGSRIITTTRNINVSEACRSTRDDIIYTMKPLSNKDSQRLFYRRIFHTETRCPDELQEVSKGILKKCGGVPLAINAIASLLASNRQIKPKKQWCHLLESIGRGLTKGAIVEDMNRILSFSYYDLPPHLKTCMLYLSMFPEDYEIKRERLIWRWMAEGFIRSGKQETSLFELGESYFNELINRSMIQPVDIDCEGRAHACRVHDMVLDMIYALSSEENFVTILYGVERSIHDLQSKVRRLSLQNTSMTNLDAPDISTTSMSQVRSVYLFMPAINLMPSLSRFQVLRVLDLEGCQLGERHDKIDLSHLGSLLHLRYLGLRHTFIGGHLPLEIGKLQFLQTLDIRRTGIKELPSSVVGLRQLMRLCVDTKMPVGLGNLVSLEELRSTNVSHFSQDDLKQLSNLTELRVLEIYFRRESDESRKKALAESIGNMHKLQHLYFGYFGQKSSVQGGWVPPPQLRTFNGGYTFLPTLSTSVNPLSLPLLSRLHVRVDQLRGEHIQILGMLPALRYLRLMMGDGSMEEGAVLERGFMITANAFLCLREFTFSGSVTVLSMFLRGAMPMLQYLSVLLRVQDMLGRGVLDQLQGMMGHLPSLEQLLLRLLRKEASDEEVEAAEAAMRHAADAHPNRPILRIHRI